jgi:hypothetical protein
MTCENKDVMEGIMHMKIKYKKAGIIFECFHNRGHPETYIPGKTPKNYTRWNEWLFSQMKLRIEYETIARTRRELLTYLDDPDSK